MRWFKETAPIRLKLLVAFGMLWCLTVVMVVAPMVLGGANWAIDLAVVALAGGTCIFFREAIAGP